MEEVSHDITLVKRYGLIVRGSTKFTDIPESNLPDIK